MMIDLILLPPAPLDRTPLNPVPLFRNMGDGTDSTFESLLAKSLAIDDFDVGTTHQPFDDGSIMLEA